MKIADFLQAFTFYYIYIKTFKVQGYVILSSQFTFYYIYIKTQPIFQLLIHILHLHSIIFILKRQGFAGLLPNECLFTFYYIYIKTMT